MSRSIHFLNRDSLKSNVDLTTSQTSAMATQNFDVDMTIYDFFKIRMI
jgi:hypothetical protein